MKLSRPNTRDCKSANAFALFLLLLVFDLAAAQSLRIQLSYAYSQVTEDFDLLKGPISTMMVLQEALPDRLSVLSVTETGP